MSDSPAGGFVIEPVAPADWPTALRILFARFPVEEQPARLEATLEAVAAGRLQLEGLRWAWQREVPVGASLVMEQPDGISLVWPPIVTCGADDDAAVEAALLAEVARQLDASHAKLGQILFDPGEIGDLTAYEAHGFGNRAEVYFLGRSLADQLPTPSASPLQFEPFDEARNVDRFAIMIEDTYRGSLDCGLLEGLRTGHEALASHKLSGEWDPRLWSLAIVNGADVGVLLLNDHPDQSSLELVYFGIAPAHRGKGYGRLLIEHALSGAANRERTILFTAVDAENAYAHSIYNELGFVELARRIALFRFPCGLARK